MPVKFNPPWEGPPLEVKQSDAEVRSRKTDLLWGMLQEAIDDETSAAQTYGRMANIAQLLGRDELAHALDKIALDEEHHRNTLFDLARRLYHPPEGEER